MPDREFLNVHLLRHADGPFIVSWDPGTGTIYGIALRAPSARTDVVKLTVLAIASGEISEVKLTDRADHHGLTDGAAPDPSTGKVRALTYLAWLPNERELESCGKVMEQFDFYTTEKVPT